MCLFFYQAQKQAVSAVSSNSSKAVDSVALSYKISYIKEHVQGLFLPFHQVSDDGVKWGYNLGNWDNVGAELSPNLFTAPPAPLSTRTRACNLGYDTEGTTPMCLDMLTIC